MINLNGVTAKSSLSCLPHFSLSYVFGDLVIICDGVLRRIKE